MYLKRLELRGFKTFALYTDFLFDAGVTAIVGPNGSGKSNIADAIRWVLGEQTFSALRGKRTEDMIFAGTSRRAQLGMAEAVMTFDNTSQWLPIDFGEVTVSRRAYRSGENQYFLNGSRVRLREVLELLGKAGLGRGGFVVLGQGLVDAALSLRPEERRALFEEAAGIHIYQEKRSDALNKLAETQQNLIRLNDILNEIAPRLRDLERQAKRAQERELLQRDLEKLLRVWYGYHWRRLQGKLTEAEAAAHRRIEEVSLARARMQEMEALMVGTQTRQNELRRQLSAWHRSSSDLHAQAEAKGRELAVNRERLSQLQQRSAELDAELSQAQARQRALEAELAARQDDWDRLLEEERTLTVTLEQARSQAQGSQSAHSELEDALESARDEAFRLATAQADASNRLRQVQERRRQLQAEHLTQQRELDDIKSQLAALQAEAEQAKAADAQTLSSVETLRTQHLKAESALAALGQHLEEQRSGAAESARKVQRLEDRREMLEGLRQSMAGFGPGARFVLENKAKLSGIVGPVASLLRTPQKLERAIDIALGANAQSLVVEHWDDASAAIELLRINSAGRVTFLPLDTLSVPASEHAPEGKNVLGLASNLVQYDQRFERVVRLLLGSVIVVEDLPAARRLRPQLRAGQRLVTLAGELVRASGMLTGGSEARGSNLLAQEREWREIPDQLTAAHDSDSVARQALQETEQQQRELQRELKGVAEQLLRLSGERDGRERNLASLSQKAERLQQESTWRLRLTEQQARELAALDEKATALQAESQDCAQRHDAQKAALQELLARTETIRSEDEAVRQVMAQAEAAVAAARRQAKSHEQLASAHKVNLERLRGEVAARSQRLAELHQQVNLLAASVSSLQAESNDLSSQILAVSTQVDPAEAEVVSLEGQIVTIEKELALARQRLSELELLLNQHELDKERQQDALDAMEQHIEEDLGDIEYPSERVQQLRMEFLGRDPQVLAVPEVLPESLSGDIKDTKTRLHRLGSVNPGAPQEYQEVLQRHSFLQTQVRDLQQSSAALHKVIAELDEVMKREFLAVFEASAVQFTHYFEHLFGGGQAKLSLVDPENPSTTGVEITARPPGKRQQSLALLSGGERALTAAALLFALLKVKPMPFCFMDEVDAMLDEANVGRFRDLLKEFSALTQFIVISHNRATIEAANTIYGISMSEEGVSKVVSLRLKEEAAVTQ